ncbi:MAG: ribonuclease Z [Candidatus Bathyarchaeia archaeon]|jgi:ribonuclease Z|nr:ribonuclease Z [Candidatus Bathyarchaeota archaeon A05DMB-4]MDH7594932.1 ribonuclease Z [Candidatus Bathyarchaeota archaeon]
MDLQVIFLGTAGSVPTTQRALPAVVVKREGELLIFDCGEGVQRQMVRARVGFHKKTKIFITHMHGDHVLGLPGLIQTMSLLDRRKELEVFGPVGVKAFLDAVRQTVQFTQTFPILVQEISEEGIVREEKEYTVEAAHANHAIPSLAYAFVGKPRPGRFSIEKAQRLGVPEGPLWSKLQHGENVRLTNGKTVKPRDVLGKPRQGRKIVYTGDTRPTKALVKLARNADLLIHDSTFDDELAERAREDGHSTPKDAAKIAKQSRVKRLVLTHISARYKTPDLLLSQARKIFKNVDVAEDFMRIDLPLNDPV